MKSMLKVRVICISVVLCLGFGLWRGSRPASGFVSEDGVARGRKVFQQYCASCHGVDGKGGGPVAGSLKVPPPDLTKIPLENGQFPRNRIRNVISGENSIPVHGKRAMPVWGASLGRSNIDNLVKYIESIQNPAEIARLSNP